MGIPHEEEVCEQEAIDHYANALADKFKDSGELANTDDKRLIVIAYREGYKHGKTISKTRPEIKKRRSISHA